MNTRIPSYLRLHTETDESVDDSTDSTLTWSQLVTQFVAATGWRPVGAAARRAGTNEPISESEPLAVQLVEEEDTGRCLSEDRAQILWAMYIELWDSRTRALRALRASEAELATAIPVISRPDDSLAQHLENSLRGVAELTGAVAAGLYMLDDATTELKLRAQWQMGDHALAEAARPLEPSVADLEALTGHAVVFDDVARMAHWNPPGNYAAAACVPVSSANVVLGTMWVFRDEVGDFTDHETHLLEMVAGGIASELERQVLLRESSGRPSSRAGLPARPICIPPEVPDWDIAASTVDPLPEGLATWLQCDRGNLWLATGQGHGEMPDVTTEALRMLVRTLAGPGGDPATLLQQLGRGLWIDSAGGQLASLAAARLDLDTGSLHFASAGSSLAVLVRDGQPALINPQATYLGEDEQIALDSHTWTLGRTDLLAMVQFDSMRRVSEGTGDAIAELVEQNHAKTAQGIADLLAKRADSHHRHPSAVLVVKPRPG